MVKHYKFRFCFYPIQSTIVLLDNLNCYFTN